jgi:dephospho-CoA kinase
MRRSFVAALTGGIGSGKTEAVVYLRKLGAKIVVLDEIARAQARKNGIAYKRIVSAFGRSILAEGGEINRKKLGDLVFRNRALRQRLESLTHPLILAEMNRRIRTSRGLVFVDIPLLFEGGREKLFDAVFSIAASRKKRLSRLSRRDGLTRAQIFARMNSQLGESGRKNRADIVLENEAALPDFQSRLARYYRGLVLIAQEK